MFTISSKETAHFAVRIGGIASQRDSDSPEDAVGDLQDVIRDAWTILTPVQRHQLLASDSVQFLLQEGRRLNKPWVLGEPPVVEPISISADVDRELLKERKGAFKDGYTPEDSRRVLSSVKEATGVDLSIVWDKYDDCGFGGDSDFAVCHGGALREITSGIEELTAFLWGRGRCPSRLVLQLGATIPFSTAHDVNYAREDV